MRHDTVPSMRAGAGAADHGVTAVLERAHSSAPRAASHDVQDDPARDAAASVARRRTLTFVALLAVATVGAHWAAARAGSPQLGSLFVMWSPGLAAVAASLLTRRSLAAVGWRVRPAKWLLAGWAAPLAYAVPAYLLVWLTGLGRFGNPDYIRHGRQSLGMFGGPDWLFLVAAFGWVTVAGLLPALVMSLGEEIGWRGVLVPELTRWVGFRRAAVASGAVWAVWHLPGVLGGAYGAAATPMAYRVACFAAMVVTTGVVLAWLRMRSGSIWPAAIAHATHNGVIQVYLDPLTIDTGPTRYFAGEFGVALVPFTAALAWLCWRRARDVPAPRAGR